MYLEKIILKNYKAIEDVQIELKPGINLLIGDNGAGKTSVLEGTAIALSGLFVNVPGVTTKNIIKDDVRMLIKSIGDSSVSVTYCEPISVGCKLKIDDENGFEWNRVKSDFQQLIRKWMINQFVHG